MVVMTWQGSRTVCVSQAPLTQSDYEKLIDYAREEVSLLHANNEVCGTESRAVTQGEPAFRWSWYERWSEERIRAEPDVIEPLVLLHLFPQCVWTSDFGKWYVSSMFTPTGVCVGICYYLQHKASWLNQAPLFQTQCQALGMQPVGEGEKLTVSRHLHSESLVQWAQWVLKAMEDLTWPWGRESTSQGDSTSAQIWRMSGNLLEKGDIQWAWGVLRLKFQKVPANRLWSRKCFALKCWCLLVP